MQVEAEVQKQLFQSLLQSLHGIKVERIFEMSHISDIFCDKFKILSLDI